MSLPCRIASHASRSPPGTSSYYIVNAESRLLYPAMNPQEWRISLNLERMISWGSKFQLRQQFPKGEFQLLIHWSQNHQNCWIYVVILPDSILQWTAEPYDKVSRLVYFRPADIQLAPWFHNDVVNDVFTLSYRISRFPKPSRHFIILYFKRWIQVVIFCDEPSRVADFTQFGTKNILK